MTPSTAEAAAGHERTSLRTLAARWARFANSLGQRHTTAIALLLALPLGSLYANRAPQTILAIALLYMAISRLDEDLPPPHRSWRAFRAAITGNDFLSLAFVTLAFGAASSLWAVDPGTAVERSGKLLLSALLGVALFQVTPPVHRNWYPYLGLAGLGLAAGILVVELSTSGFFRQHVYGAGSPVWLMNRAVVLVSLLMWAALAVAARQRVLGAGLYVLVAAAVFLSESEAAKLGLIAGTAVFLVALPLRRATTFGLAGATAILFLAMPLLVGALYHLIPDWLIDIAGAQNAWKRLEIWRAAAGLVLQNPLFGLGLEGSEAVEFAAGELDNSRFGWLPSGLHHPHNAMLQVWMELGAIGACLAAATLARLALSARRLPLLIQPHALAAFAAALSIAAVSHGAWQTWWINLLAALIILFALAGEYPAERTDESAGV